MVKKGESHLLNCLIEPTVSAAILLSTFLNFMPIVMLLDFAYPVFFHFDVNQASDSIFNPPLGCAQFYIAGVAAKDYAMMHVYRDIMPFVVLQVIGISLVAAFPSIVSYSPVLIFGKKVMDTKKLVGMMTEKAGLVQAVVSTAGNVEEVLRYAVDLTLRQNGKTIAAPGLDSKSRQALEEMCDAAGLTVLNPPLRNHLTGIHTALTGADWAIAETGSL
ncbi:MAG: hypothetical protein Q7U74_12215, partial [Saprospiraceae bacterium]|nr:hypothetical protein [Saprospiraceae bacterium]